MEHLTGSGFVFVYGTLKTGLSNHCVIEEFVMGCEPATIFGATMFDLGPFPGIVFNGKGTVKGELIYCYNIKEVIERLDGLEGYRPNDLENSHYVRRTVDVKTDLWGIVEAYTYEYNDVYNCANTKPTVEEWQPNDYWTHN